MYYIDFVLQQEQVKCRLLLLRGGGGSSCCWACRAVGLLGWWQARVLAGGYQRSPNQGESAMILHELKASSKGCTGTCSGRACWNGTGTDSNPASWNGSGGYIHKFAKNME